MNHTPILAALPDMLPTDVNIILQGLLRQREHIDMMIARIEASANQSLAERVAAAKALVDTPPA